MRIINNNTTSKIKIEKGNLTSGIYFIQLFNDRQIISNGKLINVVFSIEYFFITSIDFSWSMRTGLRESMAFFALLLRE